MHLNILGILLLINIHTLFTTGKINKAAIQSNVDHHSSPAESDAARRHIPVYSAKVFPLHSANPLLYDIFIAGTQIWFISAIQPESPANFHDIQFRVLEKSTKSKKLKRIGKSLRIADLIVTPRLLVGKASKGDHGHIVIGMISSSRLEAYLTNTDSLMIEVLYGKFNQSYHLFREEPILKPSTNLELPKLNPLEDISQAADQTIEKSPRIELSMFVLLRGNEADHGKHLFQWLEYYTNVIGVNHFMIYYTIENIDDIMHKLIAEKWPVTLVNWNLPVAIKHSYNNNTVSTYVF
jgi:hypothetical protein